MLHAFPEPGHSPARGGVYGCPHGPVVKDPPADAGATSSIPGQGTGTPQASRCPPQKKEKKQEFITIPNPWNRVRLCHCLPWRRRVEGYPLTLRPAHRRRPTTQLPPAPHLCLPSESTSHTVSSHMETPVPGALSPSWQNQLAVCCPELGAEFQPFAEAASQTSHGADVMSLFSARLYLRQIHECNKWLLWFYFIFNLFFFFFYFLTAPHDIRDLSSPT